jgi:hypothetical protein
MTPFSHKHCALQAPKKGPYTAWQKHYNSLSQRPSKTPAALSRQWLWTLQHGSAVAPLCNSDQEKLSLDQSPFVSGGGYLRTAANAYLTKQLEQIEALLGIRGNLVTVVPHAAVHALHTLYQDTVLMVPETAFTPNKTLKPTIITQIRTAALQDKTAALQDKTIWIQLPTPQVPTDLQFMSVLTKLPRLPNKKQYKLLWSFHEINTNKGTTELPLTVICGKKNLLWDHPQFLSHSGYGPDKASVDMMVIKLHLACNPKVSLESVFPVIPQGVPIASGNRVNYSERANALSIPGTDRNTVERAIISEGNRVHSFERADALSIPNTDLTIYQQLGDFWASRFDTIKSTLRDDLRQNAEINVLITQLEDTLHTAKAKLQTVNLKEQYAAIRTMADTLLVAETLCDTAPLSPADLTCFDTQKPDSLYLTTYGMTSLTGALLGYKQAYVAKQPVIATMAHTYFETSGLIETIKSTAPDFCDHRPGIATISDIPMDTDILVIEPHPNNVATKTPVTAPSLKKLATKLREMSVHRTDPMLVVMDITIGVLSDPKLERFISTVADLIETQKLHIVMGQSLVKFGALGIDVASSGLAMIWSKDTDYMRETSTMLATAAAPSHVQAFYKFMLTEGLPLAAEYLDTIRKNTQLLSDRILSELNTIQMENRSIRIMDIHPNLDRGTCYVGLDFQLETQENDISAEKFAELALKTFQKIATDDDVLMTQRSSFGFPFSNATVCGSAIRLTVGIESPDTLSQLAEIVAVVAAGLKWQEPYRTEKDLADTLTHLCSIAQETRLGFSRTLLSVEEVCVGEYETEDGFEPDFNWETTGTGILSWQAGKDHFGWQHEKFSSKELHCLEIDTFYAVNTSSRAQRAIALLSIDNTGTLYDEQRLGYTIPRDMQFCAFSDIFENADPTFSVWSKDPLDAAPVLRTLKVKNGTMLDGIYLPPEKVFIFHENDYWTQSEMKGSRLDKWKKKLYDGQHTCHIKQKKETLKLKLTPRQATEAWTIDTKKVTVHISDNVSVKIGKKTYALDQVRLFTGTDNLSKIGHYWALKQKLDTVENEKNTHIGTINTSLRQQTAENEWQPLLVMVPASKKEAFNTWRKEVSKTTELVP